MDPMDSMDLVGQNDPSNARWKNTMGLKDTFIIISNKAAKGEEISADGSLGPLDEWMAVQRNHLINRGCQLVDVIDQILASLGMKASTKAPHNLLKFPFVVTNGVVHARDMDEKEVSRRFCEIIEAVLKAKHLPEARDIICASIDAVSCYSYLLIIAYTFCYVHKRSTWKLCTQTADVTKPFSPSRILIKWIYGDVDNPYVLAIREDIAKALTDRHLALQMLPTEVEITQFVNKHLSNTSFTSNLEPVDEECEGEHEMRTNRKEPCTKINGTRTSTENRNRNQNQTQNRKQNQNQNQRTRIFHCASTRSSNLTEL